ncbi:uncharacterized protein B0J16DRAFT_351580, partial [Fusarium flagelliforme]|uniref:uncharacterized protein n=1 Tax=Fusarium flagelliforme TaxID=2675880 RepID=UPI001E8ECCA5
MSSLRPACDQSSSSDTSTRKRMPPLQTASKEKTARTFLRWAKSLGPLTLVIYSDGSLSEKGMASYGFIIHQDNSPIFKDQAASDRRKSLMPKPEEH